MRRTLVLPLVVVGAAVLAAGFYVTLAGGGHPTGEAVSAQSDGDGLSQADIEALLNRMNDPQKTVAPAVADISAKPEEPAPAVAENAAPKPAVAVSDTTVDPETEKKHAAFGDKNCPHKSDEAAAGAWKDPNVTDAAKWGSHDGSESAWAGKWQGDWAGKNGDWGGYRHDRGRR